MKSRNTMVERRGRINTQFSRFARKNFSQGPANHRPRIAEVWLSSIGVLVCHQGILIYIFFTIGHLDAA